MYVLKNRGRTEMFHLFKVKIQYQMYFKTKLKKIINRLLWNIYSEVTFKIKLIDTKRNSIFHLVLTRHPFPPTNKSPQKKWTFSGRFRNFFRKKSFSFQPNLLCRSHKLKSNAPWHISCCLYVLVRKKIFGIT